MAEKGPRPAPEQPDRIEKLDRQIQAADRFLHRRETVLHRYGLSDLAEQAQTTHDSLLQTIRTELRTEASEFVVFEAPKPRISTAKKTKEPESRKKRQKKSRGLNDPRQIEFEVPKTKRKLRGKEGKGVKLLFEAPSRILYREELANELYPGINKEKAVGMVNRTMRSARKHLAGSGFDIATVRDYEKKSTFYSIRNWEEKRSKKSRSAKKR